MDHVGEYDLNGLFKCLDDFINEVLETPEFKRTVKNYSELNSQFEELKKCRDSLSRRLSR